MADAAPTGVPVWRCRDRALDCARPLIMGILNVTPDSFSDGGQFADPQRAIARAHQMLAEGAEIIDVGGESSRPGAEPVGAEEEIRRVVPVVRELARRTRGVISVDTTKAAVARKALQAGAHIVNDITALTLDGSLADVVREYGAGVVLMHMQGTPRTMQDDPRYGDVVADVRRFLARRTEELAGRGIPIECMAVDPGIGFGKTVEHNVALLRGLPRLVDLGRPVVVGVSRKSFLGKLTGRDVGDRLAASLGALACAFGRGAHIGRVHDVKESCDVARLVAMMH